MMIRSRRSPFRTVTARALLALLASSLLIAARPAGALHSPVTLTVWWNNWGSDFDKLMVKATDESSAFHKAYPNVTVKWTFYPNYAQKLLTAVAAGSPPDMTYINSTQSQAWIQKGILTPLDGYFKAAGMKRNDFVAASFPPYEYNGRLYGLLNSGDFMAVLWNKDMFKAAGLPAHGPRTIQEVEDYNAKLFKMQNGKIVQAGFFPDKVGLPTWGLQFGGQFIDRAHKKITANDPNIVRALQWLLDQSKKWGQTNADRFSATYANGGGPQDPFYTGKLAMQWQGDWDFYTEGLYAPKLHVGVAALPAAGHGLRLWDNVSWGTAIPKGSLHPQETWQLMQYLTTGPQAAQVSAQTINFIAYKPLLPQFFKETYKIMSSKNPMRSDFNVFQDQIVPNTTAQPFYDIPVALFYDQQLARALTAVLHGKDTPKHALDAVTQTVQKEWDSFKPGQ